MEFQTSFKNIWNESKIVGKTLIVLAAIAFVIATAFMVVYGPKN